MNKLNILTFILWYKNRVTFVTPFLFLIYFFSISYLCHVVSDKDFTEVNFIFLVNVIDKVLAKSCELNCLIIFKTENMTDFIEKFSHHSNHFFSSIHHITHNLSNIGVAFLSLSMII